MSHITSVWAARYGLTDPAPPAQAVRDADRTALRILADQYRHLGQTAHQCAGMLTRAIALHERAWSRPEARTALERQRTLLADLADRCSAMAVAVTAHRTIVTGLQRRIELAYAHADAAVAQERTLTIMDMGQPGYATALAARDLRRRKIVIELAAVTRDAAATLDTCAQRALAQIGSDPRDDLPAAYRRAPELLRQRRLGAHEALLRSALARDGRDGPRGAFASAAAASLRHADLASHGTAQLLVYDPDNPGGQGSLAIALGDVTTATTVSVLVPGVANSPSDITGLVDAAGRLNDATAAASGTSAATVVWLGYDLPASWPHDPGLGGRGVGGILQDTLIATNDAVARSGGRDLATFLTGLRTVMDPTAMLTPVGHSYGSIVVSQAAGRITDERTIDHLVLLGSPGVGAGIRSTRDYRTLDGHQVYAVGFPLDPVTHPMLDTAAGLVTRTSTPFGADPYGTAFDGQVIDVPTNRPVEIVDGPRWHEALSLAGTLGVAARQLRGLGAHLEHHSLDNYLQGASLAAIADVGAGRYSRVPVRDPVPPGGAR